MIAPQVTLNLLVLLLIQRFRWHVRQTFLFKSHGHPPQPYSSLAHINPSLKVYHTS